MLILREYEVNVTILLSILSMKSKDDSCFKFHS